MLLRVQLLETLIGYCLYMLAKIGVASTKAFLGQMIVLFIITLKIAQSREDINQSEYNRIVKKLFSLTRSSL